MNTLDTETRDRLEKQWHELTTTGLQTPGVTHDRPNPLLSAPDWYDRHRYRRAQQLSRKYFLSLNLAHFIGNILLIHLPQVIVPILATGRSSTPYMVFLRILSTTVHVLKWYEDDPFDPNSRSHRSLMQVRNTCHMAVTRLMNQKYPQSDGQLWLNQFDMAMTQWSLIGLVGIRPKQCGFHSTNRQEFVEYMYFWKVIGYCMGIEDRFNICQDNTYEESVAYFDICFKRCYKRHMDEQCPKVLMGMALTEGVFLGLNGVMPKWLFSYEGFMKYWYEALGVRKHPIQLLTLSQRLSYFMMCLTMDYLLKVSLIYTVISKLFFYYQNTLFDKISIVKSYTDRYYGDVYYQ
ncbi:uncharacterized protein LOC128953152 [Oppia nitens]|uniref:uncharacterized protein LOC128953152 n=1 Tax=Oppia nitens TaxID=1686743 RepID=UPI0023DB4EAB|nr:uncharacterized protein LOC128953152 [Oppia nitens]